MVGVCTEYTYIYAFIPRTWVYINIFFLYIHHMRLLYGCSSVTVWTSELRFIDSLRFYNIYKITLLLCTYKRIRSLKLKKRLRAKKKFLKVTHLRINVVRLIFSASVKYNHSGSNFLSDYNYYNLIRNQSVCECTVQFIPLAATL